MICPLTTRLIGPQGDFYNQRLRVFPESNPRGVETKRRGRRAIVARAPRMTLPVAAAVCGRTSPESACEPLPVALAQALQGLYVVVHGHLHRVLISSVDRASPPPLWQPCR